MANVPQQLKKNLPLNLDSSYEIVLIKLICETVFDQTHYIMAMIGRSNSRSTFGRSNNGCKTFVTYVIPCTICTIALGIMIYEIAWMYYLPGLLMMNDTEELTITTQYEEGDETKVIQTKKTVTRRRPDLLFKNDNGKKVPK